MGDFFTSEQEAEIKRLCDERYRERIHEQNSKAFQEELDNSFWGLNQGDSQ